MGNFQIAMNAIFAVNATAYAIQNATPQGEIFCWMIIIGVGAMIAHAIYRFMNRP